MTNYASQCRPHRHAAVGQQCASRQVLSGGLSEWQDPILAIILDAQTSDECTDINRKQGQAALVDAEVDHLVLDVSRAANDLRLMSCSIYSGC